MPRPRRQTRIVVIDDEVFLVRWKGRGIRALKRLRGEERELALRMLDDIQAEIEAHVLGAGGS